MEGSTAFFFLKGTILNSQSSLLVRKQVFTNEDNGNYIETRCIIWKHYCNNRCLNAAPQRVMKVLEIQYKNCCNKTAEDQVLVNPVVAVVNPPVDLLEDQEVVNIQVHISFERIVLLSAKVEQSVADKLEQYKNKFEHISFHLLSAFYQQEF